MASIYTGLRNNQKKGQVMTALYELYELFNESVDAAIRIAKGKPEPTDTVVVKRASLDVEAWLDRHKLKTDREGHLVDPAQNDDVPTIMAQLLKCQNAMATIQRISAEYSPKETEELVQKPKRVRKPFSVQVAELAK